MAAPNPESAILIINDPSSSVDILRIINQFSRVFARHPIRILRGDSASDRNSIIGLTKQFHIQSVPALITRDNSLLIGRAKICSFLPQLAHAINNAEQRQQQRPMTWDEETFRDHQLRESEKMDERGEEDDPPDDAGEISKRMAAYRMEMERRHAGILQEANERAACASGQQSKIKATADSADRHSGRAPDTMPQQVPRTCARVPGQPRMPAGQRTAPVCQIRAPSSPIAAQSDAPPGQHRTAIAAPGTSVARIAANSSSDPFDRKFFEMFEESPSTISTQE